MSVARLPRSLSPRCYSMLPIVSLRAVQPPRVWCGSGLTSKEACSEIRNATAFSWLGDAAESPGLDELVPRAIVWKEALLLVRARHTRHRSSSVGERRRSRA